VPSGRAPRRHSCCRQAHRRRPAAATRDNSPATSALTRLRNCGCREHAAATTSFWRRLEISSASGPEFRCSWCSRTDQIEADLVESVLQPDWSRYSATAAAARATLTHGFGFKPFATVPGEQALRQSRSVEVWCRRIAASRRPPWPMSCLRASTGSACPPRCPWLNSSPSRTRTGLDLLSSRDPAAALGLRERARRPARAEHAVNTGSRCSWATAISKARQRGRAANYLASPPLVVAYAPCRHMNVDVARGPLGTDSKERRSICATSGRPAARSRRSFRKTINKNVFREKICRRVQARRTGARFRSRAA